MFRRAMARGKRKKDLVWESENNILDLSPCPLSLTICADKRRVSGFAKARKREGFRRRTRWKLAGAIPGKSNHGDSFVEREEEEKKGGDRLGIPMVLLDLDP